VIAAAVSSRELPIEEESHAGFDRARPDGVIWNESNDYRLDEGNLGGCKKPVARAGGRA